MIGSATIRRMLPALVIGLLSLIISMGGVLEPLERKLDETRMSLSPRPASGHVVYVAVDATSLTDVGVWPWPRSVHAEILDRLVQAGARDISLDFDFAFASGANEDAAFVAALERAGGSVYLAAFSQTGVGSAEAGPGLSYNLPYAAFEAVSWPASVNIPVDRDGLVRRYNFGDLIAGDDVPSAAALLSGTFGAADHTFLVDYAIRPDTIPTYSASDVLRGTIPDPAFEGKSIVVGAHALELRDNLAVPVHGIVPGPVIHVLAAETLIGQIVPMRVGAGGSILVLMLILGILQTKRHDFNPWVLIVGVAACIGLIEVAGLLLFRYEALLLTTAPVYPGCLSYGLWRLGRALDISTFLVRDTQAEVGNARRLLDQVFSDSSDMIVVVDEKMQVLTASRSAAILVADPASGLPDRLVRAARDAIAAYRAGDWAAQPFLETELVGRIVQYSVTPSCLHAVHRNARKGSAETFIATIAARDVTDLRRQQARIDYLATHDERTGALRRAEFLRLVQTHLDADATVSIFAIDLHRFKTINTTLGREVGDRLLHAVVSRLDEDIDGLRHAVRLGGDSFAVLYAGPSTAEGLEGIAETIERVIVAPYELDRNHAQIGVRIGYASTGGGDVIRAGELLEAAEDALDGAGLFGGTRIQRYDPDQASRRARSRAIERAMWGAIENDEFKLVYQPQVDMRTGRLIGVEVLLRWDSPTLGPIYPDQFIELAESNGFIQRIGRWVLLQSTLDAMRLPDDVTLAVNVSAIQMFSTDLVADVQRALRDSGLPSRRLWLELTESAFMSPSHSVVETMCDIEMLGVYWALDDFGTGYSSLSYLSTLPLRKLKLDKGFIQSLGTDPNSLAIVRSVGELCRGMDIKFLCEGVETEDHRRVLLEEHCFEGQGYLFGKPQTLEEVIVNFGLGGEVRKAVSS